MSEFVIHCGNVYVVLAEIAEERVRSVDVADIYVGLGVTVGDNGS